MASSHPPATAYPETWAIVIFAIFQKYRWMAVICCMPVRMPINRRRPLSSVRRCERTTASAPPRDGVRS